MIGYKKTIFIYNDDIGSVSYVDHLGTDKTIVNAARVSLGKENQPTRRDRGLIEFLYLNKHSSPFEHCSITFKFVVPLFVRSQLMRHRTWSYNEISRRYTSDELQFWMPGTFRKQGKSNLQGSGPEFIPDMSFWSKLPATNLIASHVNSAVDLYEALIKAGVAREQARIVLPVNLYTKYYGTVNLGNLFKFLDLRLERHAQIESQLAAKACLEIATDLFPVAMGIYLQSKKPRITV
jgi:thymidylate synthase (FAD)